MGMLQTISDGEFLVMAVKSLIKPYPWIELNKRNSPFFSLERAMKLFGGFLVRLLASSGTRSIKMGLYL